MKEKIVALAGRRVDEEDAKALRFPLKNRALVRQRILSFFKSHPTRVLVCSAACGADLLALDVAGELGIDRKVVLPFDRKDFKRLSVTDRPGDWGELYESVIYSLKNKGDLIELNYQQEDDEAFTKTNHKILSVAENHQGDQTELLAVLIWDGEPKNKEDETQRFHQFSQPGYSLEKRV
jgi:hypothetical protein